MYSVQLYNSINFHVLFVFLQYLKESLKNYSLKTCNCTGYMAIVKCNSTETLGSVYNVLLNALIAEDILYSWIENKLNSNNQLDVGNTIFVVCNQTCTENISVNSEDKNSFSSHIKQENSFPIIIAIPCTVFAGIMVVIIGYCFYR